MRILKRDKIPPIILLPGDSIELKYDNGVENKVVASETVTRFMEIDEAMIFEADDALKAELRISDGIGGIFAKRDDRR
jgi:hypothetical protein